MSEKLSEQYNEILGFYYRPEDDVTIQKDLRPAIRDLERRAHAADAISVDNEELVEILADIEHERWSSWMCHQFENWTDENIERWKTQMVTPYNDLPEHSKESDRNEVRKTLVAIIEYARRLKGQDDEQEA